MLGWALFVPLGFLLDPVFDRIGAGLLGAPSLRPLWTSWYNTPLVPYTNFNNTVVLGSVVAWLVLAHPADSTLNTPASPTRRCGWTRVGGCERAST